MLIVEKKYRHQIPIPTVKNIEKYRYRPSSNMYTVKWTQGMHWKVSL